MYSEVFLNFVCDNLLNKMYFLSMAQALLSNTELKYLDIESRTTCLMHKRSATELQQPAGK